VLALDEIIIAYKNSLDQTLMFGAFFQGSQDSNLLTPVTTNNCTIVYAGNANVLSLLDNDAGSKLHFWLGRLQTELVRA
jgi:hypothetical protein